MANSPAFSGALSEDFCFDLNSLSTNSIFRSNDTDETAEMEELTGTPKSTGDNASAGDADDFSSGALYDDDGVTGFEAPKLTRNSSASQILPNGKKTKGRVKIKMEYIGNKLRRYTTFSKRKTGIMKKAHELSTLTGTQVMLLVASETGHVYAFATHKLKPMIASEQGKRLIQHCLNAPSDRDNSCLEVDDTIRTEFTLDSHLQQSHFQQTAGINPRKRKLINDEILGLPTMVSPGRASFVSSPRAGPSSESSVALDDSFGAGPDDDDEDDDEDEENNETPANGGNESTAGVSCSSASVAVYPSTPSNSVPTKKWKSDGASHAERRAKSTLRPMKWTTQTFSPPRQFPTSGKASATAGTSLAPANKQAQLQRTLKEVLKFAADQRQRQKQQPVRTTASTANTANDNGTNINIKKEPNPNGSPKNGNVCNNNRKNAINNQQQQNGGNHNNQQLLFQQQLNAILPLMLQEDQYALQALIGLSSNEELADNDEGSAAQLFPAFLDSLVTTTVDDEPRKLNNSNAGTRPVLSQGRMTHKMTTSVKRIGDAQSRKRCKTDANENHEYECADGRKKLQNEDRTVLYQLPQGVVYASSAAFGGNNTTAPSLSPAPPVGYADSDVATDSSITVNDCDEDGGATPPLNTDNPFQQIFGDKFPFTNPTFQQLFASAALSQISENSRS